MDTYVYAQWRIQENILTGLCRLLDPNDVRRAWGEYTACKNTFDAIRVRNRIVPASDHLVLLVHGIARSTKTFSAMQQALIDNGYDAVAISYPSTRQSIEASAKGLEKILDNLEGSKTVSFITHSMGGLVIRQLLSQKSEWQERVAVHRIVQIAPPESGLRHRSLAGGIRIIPDTLWSRRAAIDAGRGGRTAHAPLSIRHHCRGQRER
ncbi:MAG: alpha/beta hydrolase [Alphaproteobacteria bacterium]|nr:alpha/beta hydrolase [Alphaproteobacteria bacterium]